MGGMCIENLQTPEGMAIVSTRSTVAVVHLRLWKDESVLQDGVTVDEDTIAANHRPEFDNRSIPNLDSD
jgi:hypothetical protein